MRWPENINLYINIDVHRKLSTFYYNMWKAHHNEWGREEINKLISSRYNSLIKNVNHNKLLMQPYLNRWNDYKQIVINEWDYAVDIKDEKVFIVDACHRQNMTNNPEIKESDYIPYNNPRITNIYFPPHRPGGAYYIRADIDKDWCGIRKISESEHYRGNLDKEFAVKLAEKCYAKELASKRLDIDDYLKRGR